MATLTLDKPETVRKVADRVMEAGETLVEDAKVLKAKAAELVDEGRLAAKKAYARKLREFEDLRDEAALKVRKAPFATVGITFGVGVLFGVAVGWLATRSRKA
jgi:ElaB/YqjD/DUF883 family membrane-anchored ribosome-binding protein